MRTLTVLVVYTITTVWLTGTAFATDDVPPDVPNTFALPADQIWALIAGAIVALPTYALNKYAPYTKDQTKAAIHWITAAVAAGIVQAITAGDVGFNDTTLQFIVTAVIGSIGIQSWWKKSGIGPLLGQGQNKPGQPAGPLQGQPNS